VALLVFGTPEGFGASPPPGREPSAAARAASLGGGFVAKGLNRALDELTGLEVTTGVDTSNTAAPRPEVEIRIARDVTLQLQHVLGVPPPGDNPDTNFVKFDWRLHRGFSLETTFGDKGSSIVDFVWRKTY